MIPAGLAPIATHLWQSTLCIGIAWLLAFALRNHRASVRYWIWLAASVKFLIPFSALITLGTHLGWKTAPAATPSRFIVVMDVIDRSILLPAAPVMPAIPQPAPSNLLPAVLLLVWLCGLSVGLFIWMRSWWKLRASLRAATPLPLPLSIPVMSSEARLEPGIFGIWKPVLLLPSGIATRLTAPQLHAVLAHELCHVKRRDNLTGSIHLFVETIFWFHPLVWWLRARLVAEREAACDEAVLRAIADPHDYAEGILNVCKLYLESPLLCASGVTGADLKKRIAAILNPRTIRRLGWGRKLLLAATAAAVLAVPIGIGILHAPLAVAQTQAASHLEFDVASVKVNHGIRQGTDGFQISHGSLTVLNVSLKRLVEAAYSVQGVRIIGGPAWFDNERYDVVAKGPLNSTKAQVWLMLQSLLASRFHLELRHEVRDLPIYRLEVAKGGVKLPKQSDDDCESAPPAGLSAGKLIPPCGSMARVAGPGGGNMFGHKVSVSGIADALSEFADRPVFDKTGLTGTYNLELWWMPEGAHPPAAPHEGEGGGGAAPGEPAPPLQDAVQEQLGLKLVPSKGPVPVLVILGAQKPTDNFEAAPRDAAPQDASQPLAFDVASVKPGAAPVSAEGGNRNRIEYTANSLTMRHVALIDCVQWAYGIAYFQLSGAHLPSDAYDIFAKTERPVTVAQLRLMLQDLLAKRFKLTLHRQTQMLPVYELVVAKGGPKLPKPNSDTSLHAAESLPRIRNDSFVFTGVSMPQFAAMLMQLNGVDLPVVDHTGIQGTFDLALKGAPGAAREGDGLTLFGIVEEQLGLKLASSKAPIEVIVIDHAEPPTLN
jgi:bla regulator protein blaR1